MVKRAVEMEGTVTGEHGVHGAFVFFGASLLGRFECDSWFET